MEKINQTDSVRNEEILGRVKWERNILHIIRRKANWIGYIVRRNYLLKHIIKEKGREKDKSDGKDEEEDVSNF